MADIGRLNQINKELAHLQKDLTPVHADSKIREFLGRAVRKLEAGIQKLEHFFKTGGFKKGEWASKQERALTDISMTLVLIKDDFEATREAYNKQGKNLKISKEYIKFNEEIGENLQTMRHICNLIKDKKDKVDIKNVDDVEKAIVSLIKECDKEAHPPKEKMVVAEETKKPSSTEKRELRRQELIGRTDQRKRVPPKPKEVVPEEKKSPITKREMKEVRSGKRLTKPEKRRVEFEARLSKGLPEEIETKDKEPRVKKEKGEKREFISRPKHQEEPKSMLGDEDYAEDVGYKHKRFEGENIFNVLEVEEGLKEEALKEDVSVKPKPTVEKKEEKHQPAPVPISKEKEADTIGPRHKQGFYNPYDALAELDEEGEIEEKEVVEEMPAKEIEKKDRKPETTTKKEIEEEQKASNKKASDKGFRDLKRTEITGVDDPLYRNDLKYKINVNFIKIQKHIGSTFEEEKKEEVLQNIAKFKSFLSENRMFQGEFEKGVLEGRGLIMEIYSSANRQVPKDLLKELDQNLRELNK